MAVDLPAETKEQVTTLQARLKTGCRFIDAHPRWVDPANLHLTLVFLGTLPDEAIPYLTDVSDAVANGTVPFELQMNRIELFPPDAKPPKVISATIGGDRKALKLLQTQLADSLSAAGFDIEQRPYQPHLTLARLTSVKTASRVQNLVSSHSAALQVAFAVSEIVLFESITKSSGPVYEPLHVSRFNG